MPNLSLVLARWTSGLLLCAASAAWAQELVSIRVEAGNLRAAPGMSGEVLWQLARGYPLEVLGRQGRWLRVRDFEGDEGWVASYITGPQPHHVVRVRAARLRQGPGEGYPEVGLAVYGQVLQTELRGAEWVRVGRPQDGAAWVARDLLWGW